MYVGDRDIDLDIASEIGLKNVILVEYGWGYRKNKFSPDIAVKKPKDILRAIQSFELSSE